jgi:uncharacterized iron-regulated membrane protein
MRTRWMVVGLIAIGLSLAGCSRSPAEAGSGVEGAAESVVQALPGTDVKQVTLTARATQRLGIKTVAVGASASAIVVPYSAVLYAPDGSTWVYTVRRPLTYVREKVAVVVVRGAKGDEAVLSQAPSVGTPIVSTGVVELYGTELGVGSVSE